MAWAKVCPRLSSALTPGFALVGHDDSGLALARAYHCGAERVIVEVEQGGRVDFEPVEELGIVDEPVLHDLRKAGPYFTGIERRQRRRIADHAPRLVEGADEVLSAGKVDAGLAADRGVHLGEQSRRHLHKVDAALVGGGGESGDVADHASTEGNEHPVAGDPPFDQHVLDRGEGVQRLVLLSIPDNVRVDAVRVRERGKQTVKVERSHRFVGDHEGVPITDMRGEQRRLADDVRADVNRVAPLPQVDFDGMAHSASIRSRMSRTTKRPERWVDLTMMSAHSR